MLFDLQSPRRRNFIRVVYAMLAVLMGGGLILFGIGSGGGGGLLDAVGLTDSSSSGSANFDDQIKAAEAKVRANPQSAAAQLELAKIHFQAGRLAVETDPDTGAQQPTQESNQEFELAADAWDKYLKLAPKKPDSGGAALMSQAFFFLAVSATDAAGAQSNLEDAAAASEIVAEQMPSFGSYASLARLQFFAGDTAGAEQSAKKAESLAQPAQVASLKQAIAQYRKVGASVQKQIKDAEQRASQAQNQSQGAPGAAPGATNPLENPLGGSGGLSGGL